MKYLILIVKMFKMIALIIGVIVPPILAIIAIDKLNHWVDKKWPLKEDDEDEGW